MKASKTAPWIVGASVVAAGIAAGGWLLGIGPRLDDAHMANQQTEVELARVPQLKLQLATLQKQSADLETDRAHLVDLQRQIPADMAVAQLLRDLGAVAEANGVGVTAATPGLLMPIVSSTPVPPVDPATTAGGTAESGAAALPEAPAVPTASSVEQASLSLTVKGPYQSVLNFLDAVQTGLPRLVLVSSLTMTAQEQAGAVGPVPALSHGDLELVLSGSVFAQPSAIPVTPQPLGQLPAPTGQPNPFAPAN